MPGTVESGAASFEEPKLNLCSLEKYRTSSFGTGYKRRAKPFPESTWQNNNGVAKKGRRGRAAPGVTFFGVTPGLNFKNKQKNK
ncbi:hypothetical protein J6590_051925 [Homalodisca vitripennis]|nr:hypothetical protein J6590_051925 [Homalodisca vitripennis]